MSDEILIDEEKELTPEELVDNMTLFSDDLMSKVSMRLEIQGYCR